MPAYAASGQMADTALPNGYVLRQSVALDPKQNGLQGFMQILEDARITPQMRKAMWGVAGRAPDMVLSKEELQGLGTTPLNAHLRLVGISGQVISDDVLEVPLAAIKTAFLYGTAFPTYLVTADYSIGMGSYAGPLTMLAEVRDGHLQYIQAVENENSGKDRIGLARTLKTEWRIVAARHGPGKEIEEIACRPNFDKPVSDNEEFSPDDFWIIYSTYRFDGTRWHVATRRVAGFWENEGPNSWPAQNLFPQE